MSVGLYFHKIILWRVPRAIFTACKQSGGKVMFLQVSVPVAGRGRVEGVSLVPGHFWRG